MDNKKATLPDESSNMRLLDRSDESEQSSNGRLGRMQRLRNVMDRLSQKFFKSLNLMPPITNADPEVMRALHQSTVEQLESNIKVIPEQFCNEENIDTYLTTLDELVEKSKQQDHHKQTWRPSGDVADDSRPHVMSLLQHKQEALQKMLEDLEAKNRLLLNAAQKREEHTMQLHNKISRKVSELEILVENMSDLVHDEAVLNQFEKSLRHEAEVVNVSH